ncbi:uncharacterized protein LOC128726826 [Anopheles nili]|uniref:uncharacterized protein LOC128726826 n=1 Tax=Anopheles nili TaxID=185578 RepID=UPI00237A6F69|nr:uncharacterized protein LOC128726826 [Anopheles nili]
MKVNMAVTWLMALVALSVDQAHGQLKCYVCDNCPDPYDGSSQLRDCPDENPTPTPSPPPGDTTVLTPPTFTPPGVGGETSTNPSSEQPPTPPIITPPPFPGRRKRQTPNPYRCYRIEHSNNVRRGCVSFLGSNSDTCQSINGGVVPNDCRVCDWDGCNSATGLQVSLIALLLAVVLSSVLRQ